MKPRITVLLAALVSFLGVQSCQSVETARPLVATRAQTPTYLSAPEVKRLKELLPGPFPRRADASPEQARAMEQMLTEAEVQVIRAIQDDTSAQARIRADRVESEDPVWEFAAVLGEHFNPSECPRIMHLLEAAEPQVAEIKNAAKKAFERPRPVGSGYTSKDSYPSGHSTRAFFRAKLLGAIAPERENELVREARMMVLNRMIAGKHHPADCVGGIVLGSAIADAVLAAAKDPANPAHDDLDAAKKEWDQIRSRKSESPRKLPGA